MAGYSDGKTKVEGMVKRLETGWLGNTHLYTVQHTSPVQ